MAVLGRVILSKRTAVANVDDSVPPTPKHIATGSRSLQCLIEAPASSSFPLRSTTTEASFLDHRAGVPVLAAANFDSRGLADLMVFSVLSTIRADLLPRGFFGDIVAIGRGSEGLVSFVDTPCLEYWFRVGVWNFGLRLGLD